MSYFTFILLCVTALLFLLYVLFVDHIVNFYNCDALAIIRPVLKKQDWNIYYKYWSYNRNLRVHIFSPPRDMLTAENMFKKFDKNGDGFITCDELKKISLAFSKNVSDAEVKEIIERKDKDGDGKINFEEFKAADYFLINVSRMFEN